MATISINDFGTDHHGSYLEKRGPEERDIEFAFRFCMLLKNRLGAISDQIVREFKVSFYKYEFGGLTMKLKIAMTEPDGLGTGEDFETRFEMDCLRSWDFKPEALETVTHKNIEKCLESIIRSIRSQIDLPKKKQNTMTKLLSDAEIKRKG